MKRILRGKNGRSLRDRFIGKVSPRDDGCLIWIGAVNKNGYGGIADGGRPRTASRVAYELFIGPIPDGMLVCHRCDTPLCMEPTHLFLGTNGDNRRDCKAKGRAVGAVGERNNKAKLTARDVHDIRCSSESSDVLAARYNVDRNTIWRTRSYRQWKHLA